MNLQHDQAAEVGEGAVGDVGDAVERQRQRLQVGLVSEGADGDLRQVVVIQPEVAQLLEAFEAVLWNGADVVGVQAAAERRNKRAWINFRAPSRLHKRTDDTCVFILTTQMCKLMLMALGFKCL